MKNQFKKQFKNGVSKLQFSTWFLTDFWTIFEWLFKYFWIILNDVWTIFERFLKYFQQILNCFAYVFQTSSKNQAKTIPFFRGICRFFVLFILFFWAFGRSNSEKIRIRNSLEFRWNLNRISMEFQLNFTVFEFQRFWMIFERLSNDLWTILNDVWMIVS